MLSSMTIKIIFAIITSSSLHFGVEGARFINISLIWDTDNADGAAQSIFNRNFWPQMAAACPAAASDVIFNFQSMMINKLPENLNESQMLTSLLSPSKNEFTGIRSTPIIKPLLPNINSNRTVILSSPTTSQVIPVLTEIFNQRMRESLFPDSPVNDRAAIFIHNESSCSEWQSLTNLFQHGCQCFKFNSSLTAESQLLSANLNQIWNYFVILPQHHAMQLIDVAVRLRMMQFHFRWFLYGAHIANSNARNGSALMSNNITSLELGRKTDTTTYGLMNQSAVKMFDLFKILQPMILADVCNSSATIPDAAVTGLAGVYYRSNSNSSRQTEWQLQIYRKIGTASVQVGRWNSKGRFQLLPLIDTARTTKQLVEEFANSEQQLHIVTTHSPPYVIVSGSGDSIKFSGLYIDLCRQILQRLNISNYRLILQSQGSFGSFDGTQWTGMIRTIQENRADLACAPVTITSSRKQAVAFSEVVHSSRQSILYKQVPDDPALAIFQFIQPLHWEIWIAVLGALVVVAFVIFLLHILQPNKGVKFNLYNSIYFSFAEVVQGSTGEMPNRQSGRIVVSFFWFFTLFLLLDYIANYAAFRTLDGAKQEVTSLTTLLQNRDYEFGTIQDTVTSSLLQSSAYIKMQQAHTLMSDSFTDGFVNSIEDAVKILNNASRKYALISDNLQNEFLRDTNCDLVNTGEFYELNSALITPLNSELLPLINAEIPKLALYIAELRERYFTIPASAKPTCYHTSVVSTIKYYTPPEPWPVKKGALTLVDTMGIALINLIGCLLALGLSACERFIGWVLDKRSASRRDQQNAEITNIADDHFA